MPNFISLPDQGDTKSPPVETSSENPYEFIDGWLYMNGSRVPHVPAHDTSGKMRGPLKGCIMHYGAGTFESDTRVLTGDDGIYVSATFVLSKEGIVRQLLNLYDIGWHCGDGRWGPALPYGGKTPNYCFAGIEMTNFGWLDKTQGDYAYRGSWKSGIRRLKSECIRAVHPIRGGAPMWWPTYPDTQVQHAHWIVEAMKVANEDSFEFLLGHDEMSRHKFDPGPAFDMNVMRASLDLRKD